jgi:adenine specific DNA methylase Mod
MFMLFCAFIQFYIPISSLACFSIAGLTPEVKYQNFSRQDDLKNLSLKTKTFEFYLMTELIWDGKYKDGKKVTPVRIALPFQTIETINESAQQRQKTLDFFAAEPQADYNKDWRNRLIWGDKKYVLPSLLPEFAGKVNLIYIDPPFNVGADFSFTATIADNPETEEDETAKFIKQPSIIEQKAYRDTWGKGLDSYMQWFHESALLLKDLLAQDGSIFIHLDWHIGHYAKTILDEVFGYENFINEITWWYKNKFQFSFSKHLPTETESIYWYSKSKEYTINHQKIPNPNPRKQNKVTWDAVAKKMVTVKDEKGKVVYYDSTEKMVGTMWEIPRVNSVANERLNYETQKPEQLLERIIKLGSDEDNLILDCFCGSGTTAAVAEKLNRKWITCDLGRFAIHTTRKRLLGIDGVKPFIVQNLGKYERQQWMMAEFALTPGPSPAGEGESAGLQKRLEQEKAYKHFIIELYHGKTLDGYTWLHGSKAGRMVHVGSVEAPVTVEDIKSTIIEFWKLVGKEKSAEKNGIDFLGWDFAFDVNETARQFAAENKVNVSFKKIPREVLEKKAVDQGDIKFYELAALSLNYKTNKLKALLTLDNFIIPQDDLPEEVRGKITHWSQWIDYWSVDWNYRDDTFHNEWQSYRTKQNPKIDLSTVNLYEQSGSYTVLVKVIDILGNDTTKILNLEIKR